MSRRKKKKCARHRSNPRPVIFPLCVVGEGAEERVGKHSRVAVAMVSAEHIHVSKTRAIIRPKYLTLAAEKTTQSKDCSMHHSTFR